LANIINIKSKTYFKKRLLSIMAIVFLCFSNVTQGQSQKINWISFEQLDDSLSIKPKKVFITFYADWCVYCKKMDRTGFQDSEVISLINESYYAVKMDAESTEEIAFEGKIFKNLEVGKKRRPNHQLALLLASRKNVPFTLPATIILDENFNVTSRYFEYLSPQKLQEILREE
tara:strand:+ start:141754 stop:142272 length:519 start_codon:yes stop_codon:yes gene_type:complete